MLNSQGFHSPCSMCKGTNGRHQVFTLTIAFISKPTQPCICISESVEILVFASPIGYMLTSFGFLLLNCGLFYKFL